MYHSFLSNHRWCIIELHTWNQYDFLNQCHPNKFNKKCKIECSIFFQILIYFHDSTLCVNFKSFPRWSYLKTSLLLNQQAQTIKEYVDKYDSLKIETSTKKTNYKRIFIENFKFLQNHDQDWLNVPRSPQLD